MLIYTPAHSSTISNATQRDPAEDFLENYHMGDKINLSDVKRVTDFMAESKF